MHDGLVKTFQMHCDINDFLFSLAAYSILKLIVQNLYSYSILKMLKQRDDLYALSHPLIVKYVF